MKRFLCTLTALAFAFSLAACGGTDKTAADDGAAQAEPTAEPAAEPTPEPEPTQAAAEEMLTEEQTVLNDEASGFVVTATGLTVSDEQAALHLRMENNGEQTLRPSVTFSAPVRVNGYTIDCSYFANVPDELSAGASADVTLEMDAAPDSIGDALFMNLGTTLQDYGITDIARIDFSVSALYIDGDRMSKAVDETPCTVQVAPDGEPTFTPTGECIYDQDGVRIYAEDIYQVESSDMYILPLTVCNDSDNDIDIDMDMDPNYGIDPSLLNGEIVTLSNPGRYTCAHAVTRYHIGFYAEGLTVDGSNTLQFDLMLRVAEMTYEVGMLKALTFTF